MTKKRSLLTCVLLASVAVPGIAHACDLDGLPGFHRFNPFLQESKNRWPVATASIVETTSDVERSDRSSADDDAKRANRAKKEAREAEKTDENSRTEDDGSVR